MHRGIRALGTVAGEDASTAFKNAQTRNEHEWMQVQLFIVIFHDNIKRNTEKNNIPEYREI